MNYSTSSDDELLMHAREGDGLAQNELDKRYCGQWRSHVFSVMPDIFSFADSWDVAAVCFRTYLSCLDHYRFGKSRFRPFYRLCLSHDLIHLKNEQFKNGFGPVSLDAPVNGSDDIFLHDVISSGIENDPRYFISYFEKGLALKNAPKRISQEVLMVASLRLEGLSFREIAERLDSTIRVVYRRYQTYEEEVKKIIGDDD